MSVLKLTKDIIIERISELIEIDKIIDTEERWGYDNFMMELNGKWDHSYIFVLEGMIAGYIICSVNKHILHIHRFAVKKEYQIKGIGTQLLDELVKNIDKNINCITLKVKTHNKEARKYYEENLFKCKCLVGDNIIYRREI